MHFLYTPVDNFCKFSLENCVFLCTPVYFFFAQRLIWAGWASFSLPNKKLKLFFIGRTFKIICFSLCFSFGCSKPLVFHDFPPLQNQLYTSWKKSLILLWIIVWNDLKSGGLENQFLKFAIGRVEINGILGYGWQWLGFGFGFGFGIGFGFGLAGARPVQTFTSLSLQSYQNRPLLVQSCGGVLPRRVRIRVPLYGVLAAWAGRRRPRTILVGLPLPLKDNPC